MKTNRKVWSILAQAQTFSESQFSVTEPAHNHFQTKHAIEALISATLKLRSKHGNRHITESLKPPKIPLDSKPQRRGWHLGSVGSRSGASASSPASDGCSPGRADGVGSELGFRFWGVAAQGFRAWHVRGHWSSCECTGHVHVCVCVCTVPGKLLYISASVGESVHIHKCPWMHTPQPVHWHACEFSGVLSSISNCSESMQPGLFSPPDKDLAFLSSLSVPSKA